MSYPQGPDQVDSIDRVIQSERPLSAANGNPRASDSNLSINRTPRLPPLSPSNKSHRNGQPTSLPTNGQSSPSRMTDAVSSRNVPVGHSEEDSTSSRTATSTTLNGSGLGSNMADFFSAEVFNIVIHNPTTAHRFLRFCQSRACGENMEFLQKVGIWK
jgi:phototropin